MKSLPYRLLFFIIVLTTQHGFSQGNANLNKSYSLGVLTGEHGYDMGVGIELGTPALFKNKICFRVKGTVNWLEIYKATYNHWAKYETVSLTMVYNAIAIERARIYFDLGPYYTFPNRRFSDKKTIQGITCSTGVELFLVTRPNSNVSYYFSGGIGYIHAYAEKLENKPRYGNGFVFSNGFRFYF